MTTQKRLLIAIADGEHARFVQPAEDNALKTAAAFDSREAHKRTSDLVSDRSGASFHSDSTTHHGVVPRNDPHDLAKAKFEHFVADELNAAAGRGEYDDLVIVAPAHALAAIEARLDAAAKARVIGTLAKDLVKTPNDALWAHVREWVRPVHRVPPYSPPPA